MHEEHIEGVTPFRMAAVELCSEISQLGPYPPRELVGWFRLACHLLLLGGPDEIEEARLIEAIAVLDEVR